MEYKELESKRLELKAPDEKYASEILSVFNENVTRYMNPRHHESIEDSLAFIEFAKQGIASGTNYNYMIIEKESGAFLGCCGLGDIKEKEPELGIWLKETAHHHGYGKEAIHCLYEYAKTKGAYESFKYPVDHRNIASRKIPESLGGTSDGIIEKCLNGDENMLELITYHIK